MGKKGTKIQRKPPKRGLYDRQLQRPAGFCRLCRGELYLGDVFWRMEGGLICEDCLEDFARRYFAPFRTTGEEYEEETRGYHDTDAAVF